MIFFIDGKIGNELIRFILKNYNQDIKTIISKKIDKKFYILLKKKFPKIKYFVWKKKSDSKIYKYLKKQDSRLIFLLWWPFILNKKILALSKFGAINIHPSYLPYYKGKDPNFWSILNDGPFGVSIHYANKNIDSGPIIYREKITKFRYSQNAIDLYQLAEKKIIDLFKRKYKFLRKAGDITIKTLKNKPSRINYRINMIKTSNINLKKRYSGKYIINLLRAKTFPPHEGVIFKEDGKMYSATIKIKKIT
tara:strand:+ start:56 stop:805 length:750 start_codon:yes stop_codon:yes gene_type:complete